MDSIKVNPVSFKGNYLVKGSPEILDEICWYLQRKKNNSELAFDFCDFRLEKASSIVVPSADLFLTQKEKQIAGNRLRDMLIESTKGSAASFDFVTLVKAFSESVEKTENDISRGKPIISIKPDLVTKYLEFLNLPKMKLLNAGDVFNGIKKGKFDIVNGIIA